VAIRLGRQRRLGRGRLLDWVRGQRVRRLLRLLHLLRLNRDGCAGRPVMVLAAGFNLVFFFVVFFCGVCRVL
jgi:hypothetical protein